MTGQQLKNSILQEAIEGRLVPQDPNDEPASVLLERIRAEKARLVKEKKIKKDKNESRIYRTEDGHWMEHFEDKNREDVCIDEEIPFDVPSGWEWCRLVCLFDHTSGKQQSSNNKGGGTPQKFITTSNLYWGYFNLDNVKVMNFTEQEIQTCSATKGDLLVCEGGAGYGRSAIWDKDYDICLQNHVHRLRPVINGVCEYVYHYIYLLKLTNQLLSVGTAMPGLSANRLKSLPVPLPPLAEQHRIVEKIESLLPKVEAYGKAQEELVKLNEALPEQLKKSILQEAIEGRLVPQDPNDEPASVLLERIRAEKARLVKEKKIKKDKNESRIYRTEDGHWMEHFEDKNREDVCIDEEIPFDVPDGWLLVRLSNICALIDGEKREGNYVCLDAKFLRGKSTGDLLNKGKYVSKNDNIILVDGENSGEVFTVPCDGYMGSTFKQLWTNKEMYLSYILYYLMSYKEYLRKSKKGAAIPHLNKDIFYSLIIGVPPLAEQHRIVEKLEEILPKLKELK